MVGSLLKSNSNFAGSGAWSTSESSLIVSLTLSAVFPHPFSNPQSLNLIEKSLPSNVNLSMDFFFFFFGGGGVDQKKKKKPEMTVTSAQNSDMVCLSGMRRRIIQL